MSINVNDKNIGHATAYAYYKAGGGTMTEAEFTEFMADFGTASQTAVEAAQAALASKNAAQTAATTATTKASEATTAATTATNKAAEAQADADAAALDASQALSAASTATSKASEATTAAATATSAAATATTAKDDAVSAKTAAQTAQTGAETAAASVAGSAAQIAQNASDITALKEDLTQKANIDGSYEDLVSGGAYQIISNMEEVDNTPYGYRTAGGSLEIGDREKLKKIVGVSLPVNQLSDNSRESAEVNGITYTNNGDGSITANGTATATASFNSIEHAGVTAVVGHVYLVKGCPSGGNGSGSAYYVQEPFTGGSNNVDAGNGRVIKRENTSTRILAQIVIANGTTVNNLVFKPQLFDLTAMFGTTIADYVYSLETATAGAGVAWLKSHFPRIFNAGYIPYNAGTLEHVSGLSAHKMTGFNQWDEEWEVGAYTSVSGSKVAINDRIRCKNLIPVLPNTSYYFKAPYTNVQMYYYGANGEYLTWGTPPVNRVITIPADTYFIAFNGPANSSTTYNNDICINLHWDGERDGEYESYEEHSYPLDSDVTLRGIPKLDANNNLYYDGDEYGADGTVTRKYGVVDLGTLDWSIQTGSSFDGANVFRCIPSPSLANEESYLARKEGFFCTKYLADTQIAISNLMTNKAMLRTGKMIYVRDDSYSDASTFKTAMSGVYLVYELEEHTTESADSYTEIQNVSNWGTEEFVTTSLVPVGHETAYQPDLRAKVEVAPESPDIDGYYLMKRENGENAYVAYLGELPSDPTTDGTYTLKCTVASGTATKTWEADT